MLNYYTINANYCVILNNFNGNLCDVDDLNVL